MEIRKITPEERIHYSAICSQVFLDIPRRDIRAELQNPPESKLENNKKSPAWAVFENGKMLSGMTVHDYTWRMHGHETRMGGIGAVVTLPEARGKGLVRHLFKPVFDEMLASEQVYSFLFPFHYGYYRHFGYEICLTNRMAEVAISEFARFPYPKNIQPHEPTDSHVPFAEIYATFAKNRNFSVVRSADNWKQMLDRDPFQRHQFTYLNRDELGNPDAYILYKTDFVAGGSTMDINELCYTSPAGLFAIFGFIGKMSAEYSKIRWRVPTDLNMQALLPNPYNVKWENKSSGMNRIVNVLTALNQQPAPQQNGTAVLYIHDDFRPDNSGAYRLSWENGALQTTRTNNDELTSDMAMHVTTLAQLTSGYIKPSEARYRADVTVRGDISLLDALFPKKDIYLYEGF